VNAKTATAAAMTMAALLLAAAGCAVTTAPLTVTVRDRATGATVESAHVSVRPVFLFAPPDTIVNPSAKDGAAAMTDEAGVARLDGTTSHAMHVVIIAPGYAPLIFHADHPRAGGTTDWRMTEPPSPEAELEAKLAAHVAR